MAKFNVPSVGENANGAVAGMATAPTETTKKPGALHHRPTPLGRLSPQELAQANSLSDRILCAAVILLGFLLASFPVSNSDIWMHLRVGQMITDKPLEFPWGDDPFSYAQHEPQGQVWLQNLLGKPPLQWVNTAWGFDVLIYGIYTTLGGAGLVLFRGLLFAGLGLLMLRTCRVRSFATAVSVGLALVVVTPRLQLRPEVMSFFLLGLTLYLLTRPGRSSQLANRPPRRSWIYLPIVFWFWANLDFWFFLGPITAGLYWLGETIQARRQPMVKKGDETRSAAERKSLLMGTLIGLAACLINPYHIHIFQIPGELSSEAIDTIRSLPGAFRIGASPFSSLYFSAESDLSTLKPLGLSIAEWLYFPLVALSLVSFFLNMGHGRWWRILIWLPFFLLSAYNVGRCGFFAVVAGPIMALNWNDWLRHRYGEWPAVRWGAVLTGQIARFVMLLVILALATLMIVPSTEEARLLRGGAGQPGGLRLQQDPTVGFVHPRGSIGWFMLVNQSFRASAEQMHQWRQEGRLIGNGVPFASGLDWNDYANYWAWFDTGQRSYLDTRFKLYSRNTADEFAEVQTALKNTGIGSPINRHRQLADIFNKYDISHIVIYAHAAVERQAPNDPTGKQKYRELLIDLLLSEKDSKGKTKWEQLGYIDGRTVILAWKDSPYWPKLKALRLDVEREAYRQPTKLPPVTGPAPPPKESALAWLAGRADQRPLGFYESLWYIQLARYQYEGLRNQAISAGLLVGLRIPGLTLIGVPLPILPAMRESGDLRWEEALDQLTVKDTAWMDTPTGASELMAVRAARRAIAESPNQADSYYVLYNAYSYLLQFERRMSSNIIKERELQLLVALRESAMFHANDPFYIIDPDRHMELCRQFAQRRFLDVAMLFYETGIAALRAHGPQAGISAERFEALLANIRQKLNIDDIERQLREKKASYNAQRARMPNAFERGQLALGLGLALQGRDDLLIALSAIYEPNTRNFLAVGQLAQLYLDLGEIGEARKLLQQPVAQKFMQPIDFHILAGRVAWAYGDYDAALKHHEFVGDFLRDDAVRRVDQASRQIVLGGDSELTGSSLRQVVSVREGLGSAEQRSELLVKMGMIALEAGRNDAAAGYFRKAVEEVNTQTPSRALAGRYYHLLTDRWLSD